MARSKIRIGITSARELELEVEDAEAVVKELDAARADGALVWVADVKGHRHGVYADQVAFLVVQSEQDGSGVGFAGD